MSYIPFSTIKLIANEFEKKLLGHTVKKFTHGNMISVYLIDDSLVLLSQIVGYSCSLCLNAEQMYGYYRSNPYLEFPVDGKEYYVLRIEELTPNVIGFKYNNTRFAQEMNKLTNIDYLSLTISYSKYTSYRSEFWIYRAPQFGTDTNKRISNLFPELRLEERCSQWEGDKYYYIVLELEDSDGNLHRTATHTTTMPHTYIIQLCKEWIRTGHISGGILNTDLSGREVDKTFCSWKGMRRQERLENHLTYFFTEKMFTDKTAAANYCKEVLDRANSGEFNDIERSTYLRPVNKWVSEEMVYKIAKKHYGKQYAVIYQHRPFFLRSPKGGQMSYDIFISGINVAIEYQGKQHFEPVDFFGGKESFIELTQRDKEKAKLSIKNGVRLVYINYWEEITPSLVVERIESALKLN